jgi:hypothetical protein
MTDCGPALSTAVEKLDELKHERERLRRRVRSLELAVENMLLCPGNDSGKLAGSPGPGLCEACKTAANNLLNDVMGKSQ